MKKNVFVIALGVILAMMLLPLALHLAGFAVGIAFAALAGLGSLVLIGIILAALFSGAGILIAAIVGIVGLILLAWALPVLIPVLCIMLPVIMAAKIAVYRRMA